MVNNELSDQLNSSKEFLEHEIAKCTDPVRLKALKRELSAVKVQQTR